MRWRTCNNRRRAKAEAHWKFRAWAVPGSGGLTLEKMRFAIRQLRQWRSAYVWYDEASNITDEMIDRLFPSRAEMQEAIHEFSAPLRAELAAPPDA